MRSTYVSPNAPLPKLQKLGIITASKIPFVSKLLPERIDPLGNTMKQENALGQFILPGRILPKTTGPIADEVDTVKNALKKSDPELYDSLNLKNAPSKWQRDKVEYVLTSREYEEFAKIMGRKRTEELQKLFSKTSYQNEPDDKKAKDIMKRISSADDDTKDAYTKILKEKMKQKENK